MPNKSIQAGIVFLLLFLVEASHSSNLGGYQGWLDRMGGGVRELGIGNAATAFEDAMPSAYWNPAILPFPQRPLLAFGGEVRALQRNGGFAGIQGRVFHNLGLGLGILNRGDYDVKVYDEDENYLASAAPQAFGAYLGLGIKSSRRNSFGVTLHWFHSNMGLNSVADAYNAREDFAGEIDLFGTASVNQVGFINLGWYRIWSKNFRTGIVVRNLGFNENLSARFSYNTIPAEDNTGLETSESDFFPKTLIVGASFSKEIYGYLWDFHGEILDFQLVDQIISFSPDEHTGAARAGINWHMNEFIQFRGGMDRGNPAFGFGYVYRMKGSQKIEFDYALLLERGFLTFNPYAIGFRFTL